jgi:hypothetical protein
MPDNHLDARMGSKKEDYSKAGKWGAAIGTAMLEPDANNLTVLVSSRDTNA